MSQAEAISVSPDGPGPERGAGGAALVVGAAALIAAVLALKVAGALALPGPWYLPDEVTYAEHARHVARGGEVFYRGPASGVQPGWPLVLAPVMAVLGGRPHAAYLGGVCLSSLLGTLVLVPTFLLARRWMPAAEAVLAAALAVVMPGACLYGWALLSEPLYALLVAWGALHFVRGAEGGRAGDFAAAGVLAGLAFWVRPFGLAPVAACVAGSAAWGLASRRWRPALAGVAAAAVVLGANFAAGLLARPEFALTNYPGEAAVARQWLADLSVGRRWAGLGLAAARDGAYLLVATFGVLLPLALAAAWRGLRRPAWADPATRAVVLAALVLFGGTLALTTVARMRPIEPERMYGRYLEPLLPLVVVAAAAAWRRLAGSAEARRRLLVAVVVLVLGFALVLPQGEISFTNNPGFWSWNLVYRWAGPPAALGLLAAVWLGFAALRRHRAAALAGLVGLAAASTVLVALHVHRYNVATQRFRAAAEAVAEAADRHWAARARGTLWVDGGVFLGPDAVAPHAHQFLLWLQYGLVRGAVYPAGRDQIVTAGDVVLTRAPGTGEPPLWSRGAVGLYGVSRAPGEAVRLDLAPPPGAGASGGSGE